MNLVDSVIDEVALEGLDGITLEALWQRMALRYHEKAPLSRHLTEQIWNICVQMREFSFYELEKERDKLVIYNRYEFVDPDLGITLENDDVPRDIYEHCAIDDRKTGTKGSCATYYTRKDIGDAVKSLSVQEAEKNYGRKLVIVASQEARNNALFDNAACPTVDLNVMQYCFLERVGRSRYHGEVTQGKLSLSLLNEDPKSLFYHRKVLSRHRLVTKQAHHQKSSWPSLLHLPRFYVERKPKAVILVEKLIEILKSRPNQMAEVNEMKGILKMESPIKKLLRTAFFQKAVRLDLQSVPWRTLHPHATPSEWQCKNNPAKERTLRVMQLIDPNVDINDLWKEDFINEDEDHYRLDISQQPYCVPLLTQANVFIEASKDEGLSRFELGRKMGVTRLGSRKIVNNLAKLNVVAAYMQDIGRQRVTKYVSRKFDRGSRMNKQLELEMTKMKKLTEAPIENTRRIDEKLTRVDPSKSSKMEKKNKILATETRENKKESQRHEPSRGENSRLFRAATMIHRKYKLAGCKRTYRKTFCNVADMRDIRIESKRRKLIKVKEGDKVSSSDAKIDIAETPGMRELKEKLLISEAAERRTSDVISLKDFAYTDLKSVSNVTYRLLKRANIVMEAVKEHKVIDDILKLMKMISEEEDREGYYVKIDKKSLIRLLQRLAKDNLVKNIKLTLSTGDKVKSMTFICHPSIDVNHVVIRSAVEQAKIKFFLSDKKTVKTVLQSNEMKLELPSESAEKIEAVEPLKGNLRPPKKNPTSHLVFDRKVGLRYGYAPKFTRMQALHRYLFYIIYEHPGKPQESQKQLIEVLRTKGLSIDEKLEKDMSDIFNTEIGWKMFVPPLPKHDGWPRGWALMSDLLLCLPLSIFVKLHKIPYVMPELEECLKDPIRKHLLVKNMPASMRNILLMRRKYIYDVHNLATRLCYIGLVQFGPQRLSEKDKVFVYLNRRAELMDTTSSAADYHKIEAKIYPVIRYKFTALNSVDEYWYKLWNICANTRLGGRLAVQGKEIVLEDLTKKTEMIEATQPRTPEEASRMDNSHVPGDRMGAAGIDSALFAHLKRNWNRESANCPFQSLTRRGDHDEAHFADKCDVNVSRMKSRPVRFVDLNDIKKKAKTPVTLDAIDLRKTQAKNSNVANASWKSKHPRVASSAKSSKSNRQRSYVRRILPRIGHTRARVYYDEIDHSALQRMNKLRVDWDTREDNILLICKVAMMYLCPQPRRQLIGFTSVRDALRSYSLTSYNKTSRACQRRLLYVLKTPETHHSVNLGVEELRQDFYISRRFGDTVEKLKKDYRGTHKYCEQLNLVFRDLVTHIAKKYYDITDIQASTLNFAPTTCEEFHLFHRVKYPKKVTSLQAFNDETTNDIHSSTINSVIHSSMCCVKDRRSWAYQLFRIYQQYPEWLLRSAMTKIRADQMVAIKKNYAFAIRKQTNTCMPMSSSQYQLSSAYVQKFNTKFPFIVFKEAWDFFVQLARNYSENRPMMETNATSETKCAMINTPVNGGTIAAIHDYVNILGLNFDVEIPRHIIMPDPTFQKDDERYVRIARRYQDILRNFEHVNIDDILNNEYTQEARNDRTDHVAPVASSRSNEDSSRAIDRPPSKTPSSDKPKDPNPENDAYPRRLRPAAKSHDSHEANDDTEAIESDHEMNFDDEDCYDEFDENDCEDDDLICFIDGTKIRLTREDIENSGYAVDPQHDSVTSRVNKRAREHPSSNKLQDDRVLENPDGTTKKFKQDITGCPRDDNAETEVELLPNPDNSQPQETQSGDVRVNELIERANFTEFDSSSYLRTGETYDVQKRYTRLAMLRMREELHDLASNDSHHAHEYFVLNMFKVFYSLRHEHIERPLDSTTFQGLQLPNELFPLNCDGYSAIIEDLKKFAIFPKTALSYERFKKNLRVTDVFKCGLDAVYEFIRDRREIGASLSQLSTTFYSILGEQLFDILSVLKEERMVLRSGVTNTRYIHEKYADPWLIHSYKIMRLQKEAHPPTQPGSLYVVSEARTKDRNDAKREIVTKATRKAKEANENVESNEGMDMAEENEDDEPMESGDPALDDSEAGKASQGKMQKSRTCLLPTKDIYRAAKQLDLNTAEEIRVVVRPWIRIDGALNRRVLDRMLGGVLAYCLVHPGVHLTKIEENFSPAIQPFHTKELVEILMRLECLKMGYTKKPRVTLFSKSALARSVFLCSPERCKWPEDEVMIEPTLDATLKFSMFLSTRTYTSDFLA